MKPSFFLQLGRVGDILNVLPLCEREYLRTGNRPGLMVAADYAEILDGVGYVDRFLFNGPFEEVGRAHEEAQKIAARRGDNVVCTQIYGRELWAPETCSSFVRQSWAAHPDPAAWGSLPLNFDRRDLPREVGVARRLRKGGTGKPYVVLALSGTSSPFAHTAELMSYLRNKCGREFDFVNVSAFIAPRFYDLLTLFAGATALIATDSAPLHLAAAVKTLPVVGLITREPSSWHGTAWRPQHVARFFYDECPACFGRLVEVLGQIVHAKTLGGYGKTQPVIRRVWSQWTELGERPGDRDPETLRRVAFARATWEEEARAYPRWEEREYVATGRESTSAVLGDPRPVPYIKEMLQRSTSGLGPDDIVAFCNADLCCVPGITGPILDLVPRYGAAFTHRYDFERLTRPILNEDAVARGKWYAGSDAFFFTVGWWRKVEREYPDMLLGREQSDEVLRQLVKRHRGLEIPRFVYHEKHASFWEEPTARKTNPGNLANRALARKWFVRTQYAPDDWNWWRLPGGSVPAPRFS